MKHYCYLFSKKEKKRKKVKKLILIKLMILEIYQLHVKSSLIIIIIDYYKKCKQYIEGTFHAKPSRGSLSQILIKICIH